MFNKVFKVFKASGPEQKSQTGRAQRCKEKGFRTGRTVDWELQVRTGGQDKGLRTWTDASGQQGNFQDKDQEFRDPGNDLGFTVGEDGGIQGLSKLQSQNLYGKDEGSIQRRGVTGCRLQEEDKEFRGRTKVKGQVKSSGRDRHRTRTKERTLSGGMTAPEQGGVTSEACIVRA